MKHLLSNSLISRHQFGFRPQSSTQEALLAATNDWHQYLDSNLSVGCVAFDLSKAFDSLLHQTILSNLSQVSICGSLLNWFHNYLSNREQKVVLNGNESFYSPGYLGCPPGLDSRPSTFCNLHRSTYRSVPLIRPLRKYAPPPLPPKFLHRVV